MQLSKHFKLEEFLSPNDPHKPTVQHAENLKDLCELVLEPLREALGRPIRITSGYRSPLHNKRIGGHPGSLHKTGLACDFAVKSDDEMVKVAAVASRIKAVGAIGLYPGQGFVHVDIRRRVGTKPIYWMRLKGVYTKPSLALVARIKLNKGVI